jgi:hypothetical protein
MLTVLTGKDGMGNPVFKSILLVDALKHGAKETVNKALQGASSTPVSIMGYIGTTASPCGNRHPEASVACFTTISGEHWSPIMEIENGTLSINPLPEPSIYQDFPPQKMPLKNRLLLHLPTWVLKLG